MVGSNKGGFLDIPFVLLCVCGDKLPFKINGEDADGFLLPPVFHYGDVRLWE